MMSNSNLSHTVNNTFLENTEIIVSVCVQTYQHTNFISQCLDSILMQQTSFPIEIILGEDESDDGTRKICLAYANKYPKKIKLFLRSRRDVIYINEKPTGRFNMMQNLKEASGKYIAMLEGDDYWIDPLKLEKQVNMLEASPTLIASHHWQKIAVNYKGHFIEKEAPKHGSGYCNIPITSAKDIFSNTVRLKVRTLMFRNIINENFFPVWMTKVAFGDVPLSFILGKHGDFGFINEEMAVYRQTNTGASTAGFKELGAQKFRIQHFKNWIDIWDKADKFYNYKHRKQASNTISYFLKIILETSSVRPKSLFSTMSFNYKRDITKSYKAKYGVSILKIYFRLILKKIKNRSL